MTNQDYKNSALDSLKGNWSAAVLATVVFCFIALLFVGGQESPTIFHLPLSTTFFFMGGGILLSVFLILPLEAGYCNAFLKFKREGDPDLLHNTFALSFDNYLHKVWGLFLMELKVCLWCVLFIIPGFVMSFAYAMTPFILQDHPELSAWEASAESRRMMKGHKFDLFYLLLSFIGWVLLAVLTCGIGFFWLGPYATTSVAAFYEDIKGGSLE